MTKLWCGMCPCNTPFPLSGQLSGMGCVLQVIVWQLEPDARGELIYRLAHNAAVSCLRSCMHCRFWSCSVVLFKHVQSQNVR